MPWNLYVLRSSWLFAASTEAVWETLLNVQSLPQIMPEVCPAAEELPPDGSWRRFILHIRGFLPHTIAMHLRARTDESEHEIVIHSEGDLVGEGKWIVRPEGENTRVFLHQDIRPGTRFLKAMTFLLKPLCVANHNWVMRKTGEALARHFEKSCGKLLQNPVASSSNRST